MAQCHVLSDPGVVYEALPHTLTSTETRPPAFRGSEAAQDECMVSIRML